VVCFNDITALGLVARLLSPGCCRPVAVARRTDAHIGWARETYQAFDAVGSDAGYINFLEAEQDRVHSVYPPGDLRPAAADQQRLDPDRMLTGNIPIEPGP